MQQENSLAQCNQDSDQQPENLIRQGYMVRDIGDKTFIVPNALQHRVDLPLANMANPDFSRAVEMPGGVSYFLQIFLNILDN